MNILMTGATGMVGTALVQAFTAEGHVIYRLVRPGSTRKEPISNVFDIPWNPATGEIRDVAGQLPHVNYPNIDFQTILMRSSIWPERRLPMAAGHRSAKLCCGQVALTARVAWSGRWQT